MNIHPGNKNGNVKVEVKKPGEGKGKIAVGSEGEFKRICKSLTDTFQGLIRLWGDIDKNSYSAALLVRDGLIEGLTFEHLDTAEITYGTSGYQKVLNIFSGSAGDLEIFRLSSEEFDKVLEHGIETLLDAPVKLTSLNIKIKSQITKPPEPHKKGLFGKLSFDKHKKDDRVKQMRKERSRKIRKINVGDTFSLTSFARNITGLDQNKAKRFREMREKHQKNDAYKKPVIDQKKQDRFKQIKERKKQIKGSVMNDVFGSQAKEHARRRDNQLESLKLGYEGENVDFKKKEKQPRQGEKITTPIDRLYDYVQENGEVKITDQLAQQLDIEKNKIEEWSMILEERHLLILHYPPIGEPVIQSKEKNRQQEEEKK